MKKALLLILSVCFIVQSLAEESLPDTPNTSTSTSNKPWRTPSSQSQSQSGPRAQRYASTRATYAPDYTSHFLDQDWLTDKRARLWQVDLKRRRNESSWTTRLTLLTVATYALQFFRPSVTQMGIKLSEPILRGEQLYRLVTPIFLHGGLGHLFTNMYSLNQVGPDFERLVGPGRYLATYLAAGVAGNILSAVQSRNPSLGASGAVFGVFGAYYVFLNRNEWLLGEQGQEMAGRVTQVIGMNLLLGLVNPVIDNWGHLGGAIGGAACAYYFGPRLFLSELPEGERIVVDKPVYRLPRCYEAIPERVGNQLRRMTRRMRVERYKSELTPKPWRQSPSQQQRQNPRSAPNRSIKPRAF